MALEFGRGQPGSVGAIVRPPNAAEAAALAVAATFLRRSGTSLASLLLVAPPPAEAALLESVRDSLLAGAALCDGLLDLPAGGEPHR